MSGFAASRDDASAEFYDAAARGVLLIRRCPACGTAYAPQQARCADGSSLQWSEAAGYGALVSWAVDHAQVLDRVLASPDGTTSTIGLVELSEGPWLQVPIVDADPATLGVGTPMRVRFVRPGGGEPVPVFSPA